MAQGPARLVLRAVALEWLAPATPTAPATRAAPQTTHAFRANAQTTERTARKRMWIAAAEHAQHAVWAKIARLTPIAPVVPATSPRKLASRVSARTANKTAMRQM